MNSPFSPEGIMRIIIAIFLDIFGLICLGLSLLGPAGIFIGEILSYVPDILGFVFLSGCSRKKIKDKKFLLTAIGEFIPFLGALPFWTFYILSERKE